MNNTLYRGILFLFSGSLLMISCKKTYEFEVSGKVYNKNTNEPIEGATVTLVDGLETNDFLLPSDGGNVENVAYTDVNGHYQVKLKTKESWHAVLWANKSAYQYRKKVEGTEQSYEMFGEGRHVIDFPMEGIAYFDSPFMKKFGSRLTSDSLKIMLLSYEDINDDLRSLNWSNYVGMGPFHFFVFGGQVRAVGDRYLRYKLEWTNDGVWQSKIDSVYLPTSLEVYRDTIYY